MADTNAGKKFEQNIKNSFPDYCLVQRLNDTAQSFKQSNLARFTPKNPCDFFVFDSNSHILYCLELKSTKYKSMAFEDISSNEKQNKMIHKHQIIALTKFSKYENVIAGFILNFRDEKNNIERTYFFNIKDFNKMCEKSLKCSFNEMDLILNNSIKIKGNKKITNYKWDLDEFLKSQIK